MAPIAQLAAARAAATPSNIQGDPGTAQPRTMDGTTNIQANSQIRAPARSDNEIRRNNGSTENQPSGHGDRTNRQGGRSAADKENQPTRGE
jgi:hypothetical protein